jgi:hypothetical protein
VFNQLQRVSLVLDGLSFILFSVNVVYILYIFSLFHFRNWLWSNLPTHVWYGKAEASKRVWTDLVLRSSYPYKLLEWNENDVRR